MPRPRPRRPSRALALRLLLCALSILLFAGCRLASHSAGGMAPGYGGDSGSYEREEAYAYEDQDYGEGQLAEAPPPMAPSPDPSPAKKQRSFGDSKEKNKDSSNQPAPTTADTASTPAEQAPDLEAPATDEPPAISNARQIIYTATMQVSVYDVAHAIELVEALPDRFGGWLHQRVDNQVVLRIPAARLQEVMAFVGELGVVDYRLLEALDVTAEYTDLESRIRVLEQMQGHLQALLQKAESVEQALEIRRALDDITLELESARAQMRELAKSIAFSTLILRLVERGPVNELPTSNDPFPWVDELGVEATDYR
jgi:chemotaxis protein histidine kinase CheA